MERKLVSLRRVNEIKPIEGADSIELAIIDGWQCVIKKGELIAGDMCVYHEIDCLLPADEHYMFLAKNGLKKSFLDGKIHEGFRLKTIKLRGQISQGLALPTSILGTPELLELEEGMDVTEWLGVVKYEKEIPANLRGQVKRSTLPDWIKKTDEERIQNMKWVIEKYADTPMYVAQKLDGSSITVYWHEGEFGVCSRNQELLETEGNTYWKVVRHYKIEEMILAMKKRVNFNSLVLQGELFGEGIQQNPEKISGQKIAFFNVTLDGIRQGLNLMKLYLYDLGLQVVPILETGFFMKGLTIQDLLTKAEGKSSLSESEREGIVIRPVEPIIDEKIGELSFKVISNKYLLEEK